MSASALDYKLIFNEAFGSIEPSVCWALRGRNYCSYNALDSLKIGLFMVCRS